MNKNVFKTLLLLSMCMTQAYSYCQNKRTVNWYFGKGAALSFSSCEPVALADCSISEVNSTATMSDEEGNLLYYIDNHQVTNRKHQVMANGDGIDFYNWNISQAILSIPMPGSSNKYVAFTIGDEKRAKLLYHEIDMSDGIGRVTVKNKQIFNLDVTMRMSAVNHANGEDVWLMVQGLGIGKYYAFLITKNGISKKPIISDFNITDVDIYEYGPMKFSSDGTKMVSTDYNGNYNLLFYKFNNATGQLTDQIISYCGRETPNGIEFSPNAQFVYVSTRSGYCSPGTSSLYQYNINEWSNNISTSRLTISSSSENYSFLQLAINGKIYMGGRTKDCNENPYIHAINNPNQIGVKCDFKENAIYLGGKFIWDGLCNFNQSYFDGILPQLSDTIKICPEDTCRIKNGKFKSSLWKIAQTENKINVFKERYYSIDVINSVGCVFSDSAYLTLHEAPSLSMKDTLEICQNDWITIDAGDFKTYLWNTGEKTRMINANTEQWFSVEVNNEHGCYGKDSTYLTIHNLPQLNIDEYHITETDTIIVNPGSFHSYMWSNGSLDSKLEIFADDLPLGENRFSIRVQNQYECYNEDTFTVYIKPANRQVEKELSLKFRPSMLSVTNKSGENKNHEIIIYSLNGSIYYKEKVPAHSKLEVPLTWKGYLIILLKNDSDTFVKKMFVN